MKVVKRWPEININWLMFGNGEMYSGAPVNVPTPPPIYHPMAEEAKKTSLEPDLFSQSDVLDQVVESKQSIASSDLGTREFDNRSSVKPVYEPYEQQPAHVPDYVSSPRSDAFSGSTPVANESPEAKAAGQLTNNPQSSFPASGPSSSIASPAGKQQSPADVSPSYSSRPLSTQPRNVAFQDAASQPDENRINEIARPDVPVQAILSSKKIVKMIILYEDHSFAEYYPE